MVLHEIPTNPYANPSKSTSKRDVRKRPRQASPREQGSLQLPPEQRAVKMPEIISLAALLESRAADIDVTVSIIPSIITGFLPRAFTSPVEVAGPAGAGKTNFMLACGLDRVINSWFGGGGDFIVYLQAGMEVGAAGGTGVAKRIDVMAHASLTAYVESLPSLAPLVDFYNSHKYMTSALPTNAKAEDLVTAIKAHAMANFVLLPCPNSEEFELIMGIVEGGDQSKTIEGVMATMERRNGAKCALVCVDSIAGLYRSSYSDRTEKDLGGAKDNARLFKVARSMRNVGVGFLVANQATANFESAGSWKACFGIAWANCCQIRIHVDREYRQSGEGGEFKRTMEVKDMKFNFKIVDSGIVHES